MLSAVDGRPSGQSGRRAAWMAGRPCILSMCVYVIGHHHLREM